MTGFGWYAVFEGPGMLSPGIDPKLLKASQHRVCEVCATKLQLAGIRMNFEGPPDGDPFTCFYCLAQAENSQNRRSLRLVS